MDLEESLKEKLKKQPLGTHMCCIYRDKEEQLSALASFISAGVKRNERCFYIVDDRTKEEVVEGFEKRGFAVEEHIESGQFEFLTKSESYLREERFDPDKMITLLKEATETALEEGYNGLRVTGEMTWVFSDKPGVERLMEYESKLNEFIPDSKATALCQYNEERFSPEILVDVLRTHPKVLLYDDVHENTYFMPPSIFRAQMRDEVTAEHYERMKENILKMTRLKREEEEAKRRLKRERDRAERYLETAEVMLVGIDKDGEVIQANRKASEVLGHDKEDIVGKDWFENFVPEREKTKVREVHEEAGKNTYPEYFENPVLTASGEERIILWHNSVLEDEEGEMIGTLSSGMDITERNQQEEELKELSRFREKIIQDANIWLNVLDDEANVVVWNKAAEDISGYPEEEVVGHDKIWELLYPDEDYRREITEKVEDILSGEKIETYETRIRCKNGEEKMISWNSHPLENDEGEVMGSIALGRDITEQKKAEEREEFLNILLKQDLRGKFQIIQGYLQLLEDVDLDEEHTRYLERAEEAGRQISEILETAEELDKITTQESMTDKEVPVVFEHVLEDISEQIDSDVNIVENYEEGLKGVRAYHTLDTLFSQILKVRLQESGCGNILIEGKEKNDKVMVAIQDDGDRLPEDIKELFSGKSYTGVTAGVGGVRYYLLKEIAEHNDAEIEVGDPEDGGARFEVYLKPVEG